MQTLTVVRGTRLKKCTEVSPGLVASLKYGTVTTSGFPQFGCAELSGGTHRLGDDGPLFAYDETNWKPEMAVPPVVVVFERSSKTE